MVTMSRLTSSCAPSPTTMPLTATRPSSISSSHRRRLATPARARILCTRSDTCRALLGGGFGNGDLFDGIGAQAAFELFHHVCAGHELAEGRQLIERVETEPLEEHGGGAEQRRL